MINIKTVAQRAGVSPTTASCALNNRPGVKQDTIQKVLQAAKELNYTPNSLAQSFRSGKSNTIAVVTRENLDDNSIFSLELMGIITEARALNYDVLVKSVSNDSDLFPEQIGKLVESKKVDGVIFLGNGFENQIEQMVSKNLKMVLLSSHSKHDVNVVNVDGEEWIYKITEYLIKRGLYKIAYVTFALETMEELNRERGFKKALVNYGLSCKDSVIESGYDSRGIFEVINKLVSNNRPQAIVCWNDTIALQVINVLREIGLKVPGDIAVTGFDDILQDMYYTPHLTTIKQPFTEKGKCAMNLLVDLIELKLKGPVKKFVGCELMVRESV